MVLLRLRTLRCLVLMSLGCLVPVSSISREELLLHGEAAGDQQLEPGNDQTREFALDKSFLYFDGKFDKVYINTNGFVATEDPTPEATYLGNFQDQFGGIAALMGDLDTSGGAGRVYFRQDTSATILRQAAEHINRAFPEWSLVEPSQALVVTWEDVATHEALGWGERLDTKRNTFQLLMVYNNESSYAVLLYPKEGMQFLSSPSGAGSLPMLAGFSRGDGAPSVGPCHHFFARSEQSIRDLTEKTNSGRRGVWVFKIGSTAHEFEVVPGKVTELPPETSGERSWGDRTVDQEDGNAVRTHPGGNLTPHQRLPRDRRRVSRRATSQHGIPQQSYLDILQAQPVQFQPRYQPNNPQVLVVDEDERDISVDVFPYNFETCTNNRQRCSNFADCRDYPSGYCCHCRSGFYGNGKQCLAEGKPQRMNGKVSGRVFVGDSRTPLEFNNNDLHSYVVTNDGRAYVAISTIPLSLGPSLLPLSSLGGAIGWAFALEQPGFQNGFSIIGGEFTRQAEVVFQPGNERLTIKQQFQGIDEHDHLVVSTELEGRVPEIPLGATVQIDPYSEIYQYSSNLITSSSNRDYTVSLEDGSSQTRSYQWRQTVGFQGCSHDETQRATLPPQQLSVDQIFVMYDSVNQLIRYAMSNKIGSVHGGPLEENPCFTGRHGCDTNAVCKPGQGSQYMCECSSGFTGDGRVCYDIDECRDPQVCGPHTACNNQPGTFRCQCDDGFQFASDGQTCIEVARPVDHCQAGSHDCDIPQRARCSYAGGSSYICSCLQGFVGDGRACRDTDECQQGRCHQDAVCYNTQGSFTCQCRSGFHGDGFYCSTEREKTRCEQHRESVLASTGEFGPRGPRPVPGRYVPTCDSQGNYEPMQCHTSVGQCWCVDRSGQEIPGTRTGPGNRPMCMEQNVVPPPVGPTTRPDVDPLPPGTHLLFAQSGKIEYIPLNGYEMKKSEARTLLHLPEKVAIGVAFDCVEKMVYWTDITAPSISKANLLGGEPIAVIRTDLESPEGIAIDHLGRTMFWTDSMQDRIEVASLDGSQRRVLFDTDLVNPRAIIADPARGRLYWADWNRDAPKIETSYMDGTNRRTLVKDDLGLPNGLTYDPQTSMLCWADAGTHKVECIDPTHGSRRKVLEGIQYPFGMTSYGKNIYYTDWRREAVVSVDRSSGRETDEFQPQKRSRLYGITTAYSQCPSGRNYCSVNNGGCTHLCLATPAGRSCVCPDNAVGVSCVERGTGY